MENLVFILKKITKKHLNHGCTKQTASITAKVRLYRTALLHIPNNHYDTVDTLFLFK